MPAAALPHSSRDPVADRRLNRIRAFSRFMAGALAFCAVMLPLVVAVYWLATPGDIMAEQARVPAAWLADFGLGLRFIGLAITLLPLALLVWGLLRARAFFTGIAGGVLFGSAIVISLRDIALAMAGWALLMPLASAANSVVLSWHAPAGQHQLVLSFSQETLLMLLFAGLVAVIATVMAEASALAEEHAQFI